jgi:type VI secretion system protein ImpL
LTAQSHLLQPLHSLLNAELVQLKAIRNTERRGNVESEDPAQWQNYAKAKDLVARAVRLEQQNQWFNQALNNPKAPLEDLALLSNNALSLNLNVGTLRHAGFYNRVLLDTDGGDFKTLAGPVFSRGQLRTPGRLSQVAPGAAGGWQWQFPD